MNLVDALMAADKNGVLLQETEKFEVERLSKLLGVPFVLTLQPVPAQRYTEIQAAAVKFDKKGREKDVDLYYLQMHTMVAGIKEPNFGEHALLKKLRRLNFLPNCLKLVKSARFLLKFRRFPDLAMIMKLWLTR